MKDFSALHARLREQLSPDQGAIIDFLRQVVAIPSHDGMLQAVGDAIGERMLSLGFDEVRRDSMGNILGRIGSGSRVLLFDSHIDTVGVGDRQQWQWDPFQGKLEDGIIYGLGAGDEKCSTPPMIYGLAALKRLGLAEDWTLYYFGNMEEWCDGIAPHALVEHEGIRPDYVIVGEPTGMQVYRGHRGRIEVSARFSGRSCHASAPERGINPAYLSMPFVEGVRGLNEELKKRPDNFLGPGSIAVTSMHTESPSLNAVPASLSLYIDRRITVGETEASVLEELRALPGAADAQIEIPRYDSPSYTGFRFPVPKVYPAWELAEEHVLVSATRQAAEQCLGRKVGCGKWVFSTNATYWMGKAQIPSVGFAPGQELYAHTVLDQVPVDELVQSAEVYAMIPVVLGAQLDG